MPKRHSSFCAKENIMCGIGREPCSLRRALSMRLTFTRPPKMQKRSLRYFPIALFSRDASIAARMHRQISPGTASTKQYSTTGQTPIGVPK